MKRNTLAKSTQIRPAQKFKTAINNFSAVKKSQQLPANRMKTSINNTNTKKLTNPPSESAKSRKSEALTTTKKKSLKSNNIENNTINKKKSIIKKSEPKSVRKNNDKKYNTAVNFKNNAFSSSKKNSMSVSLKRNNMDKNKSKTTKIKNENLFNSFKGKAKSKTAKKSEAINEINEIIDEEEDKIKSKDNPNFKDLKNSQTFNKNESIGINIMNNINDENENINLDNNIIFETENEKNLTDEKNDNIKESNMLNSPIQNELIKEKVEGGFINGVLNVNPENKLKNKKLENSEYISEKNKNTMRNLLYLLEKKPEENKNQKSLFRASINTLEKREKNKLLDIVYQNRKNMYRTILDKEVKKLNSVNMIRTPNLINEINSLTKINKEVKTPSMQTPFLPDNFEDKYQNMKNKYLIMASPPNPRKQYPSFYHDKYFMDYVDGRCPNLYVLEKNMKYEKNIHEANNDNTISEKHKFNRSFNDRFHFMEKNDLFVEKRDNRYMYYNYKFMVNAIDDKLNGFINDSDFRHSFQPLNKTYSDFHVNRGNSETYRNQRISKLYNEINNDIYSVGPEYRIRKSVSERNPFL